jgi:hypothetical protein
VEATRNAVLENGGLTGIVDEVDGSWQKRGHTSPTMLLWL